MNVRELQSNYFNSASARWREHLGNSGHPEYFWNAFEAFPCFYTSARPVTERVAAMRSEIEAALASFGSLYPSRPVPVTIGIGRASSAGRGYNGGVYLAAEMFVKGQGIDTSELPAWTVSLLSPPEAIVPAAIHEAVHTFQPPVVDPVLLVACLREGAASLVAELVTGHPLSPELMHWCQPRKKALFQEFSRQIGSTNYSGWLYNAGESRSADRPADTGYWVGYEIARDFYARAPDKRVALRDLIDMHDPRTVVRKSAYRWLLQQGRRPGGGGNARRSAKSPQGRSRGAR